MYERLSWPKVGFFYHFIDDELINEYQLAGGDKWSFKVTQSKGKMLSNELLSEHEYSFILLPWKNTHHGWHLNGVAVRLYQRLALVYFQ